MSWKQNCLDDRDKFHHHPLPEQAQYQEEVGSPLIVTIFIYLLNLIQFNFQKDYMKDTDHTFIFITYLNN